MTVIYGNLKKVSVTQKIKVNIYYEDEIIKEMMKSNNYLLEIKNRVFEKKFIPR